MRRFRRRGENGSRTAPYDRRASRELGHSLSMVTRSACFHPTHLGHGTRFFMEGTKPQEQERADRISRSINVFERLRHEVQRRGTSQTDRCPPQSHQLADVSKLQRAYVEASLRMILTLWNWLIESQIFPGFLNELC